MRDNATTLATDRSLTATEEAFWRALLRVVIALPRALETDLIRSTGLTMTEMIVLISLHDAQKGQLRMSQLAHVTALSASRVTRIVADLQRRGLVDKRVSDQDGRGYITELTAKGRGEIERTYPDRIRSVRRHVVDRVDRTDLPVLLRALQGILEEVESDNDDPTRTQ